MAGQQSVSATPKTVTVGEVQWQVLPDWAEHLIGAGGLRLDEWLRRHQAQIVKTGSHRTVYRVDLPERAFYLKHYRSPALKDTARHLVRASASRREFWKALEMARRQVPTVKPVAVGERLWSGVVRDHFFVAEAIPHSCSLNDYVAEHLLRLDASDRVAMRRKLTLAMARLCADAHRAGVLHDDLHGGNVLVRIDTCRTDDARLPQLYLLDVPGVQLSHPLDWPTSRANLVMLNNDWAGRASRAERWRFWQEYLRRRTDLQLVDPRAEIGRIGPLTHDYAMRLARSRDRRCLRTTRDAYRLQLPGAVGHAVTAIAPADFERLLADSEWPLRHFVHQPVKLSHSRVLVQAELPVDGVPTRVAYKRVRAKNWYKALLGLVRRSRAMHGWYLGHALLQRGIPTARPLAVCEPRGWPPGRDSYLATAWIDGAIHLHDYATQLVARPADERRRRTRQCADSLGRLIGRMHAWRISSRDLKSLNLVLVERDDKIDSYLIDLDGVTIHRWLSRRTMARNVARLATSLEAHPWISRTDRLRFLRAYLRELPAPIPDWKQLWRAAGKRAKQNADRLRRGGRQVI